MLRSQGRASLGARQKSLWAVRMMRRPPAMAGVESQGSPSSAEPRSLKESGLALTTAILPERLMQKMRSPEETGEL